MQYILKYRLLLVSMLFMVSCSTTYQPQSVQYKDYRITEKQPADAEINALLQPYADSVNKNMNDVIAISSMPLDKKQPEGTLGNVLSDAMLAMSQIKYQTKVDACFVNAGGIRLPSIAAGNITRGKIYELAPFDNIIVLLQVNGKVLQEFLNLVAARGGWPCAGISYQIKNKEAINIRIADKMLEPEKKYFIALVDYIANGGDDCVMLKNIPQQNKGYLFRDAVIDYFTLLNNEGKKITGKIENRVSYAN